MRLFFILLLLSTLLYAAPKVKEDFSKIGVEGPTTTELNIPTIEHKNPLLSDNSYRFKITPNFTIWPLKDHDYLNGLGMTLAYIGIYDFYFGTKESGPIISRLQNPFFYVFFEHPINKIWTQKYKLGIGHESNGQIINSRQSYDYFKEAYSDSIHGYKSDGSDLMYSEFAIEDWISMGWNYYFYNIEFIKNEFINKQFSFKINWQFKWFFTHGTLNPLNKKLEENIFYDDALNNKTSIKSYDGNRYKFSINGESRHFNFYKHYYLIYDPNVTLTLRHGYFFRSFNPTFEYKTSFKLLGSVPLFYSFKHGYGRDISSYPYSFHSHAIGLEFNY